MKRLKQKLNSESGASILLAMLFLLICTLVAAALLMAAVSNAGKIKSNQEMHQKYLTVSSALQLICEDLLSAEYYGQYDLVIDTIETPTGETDAQGKPIMKTTFIYNYNQCEGKFDCKLGKKLIKDLDAIFAEQMKAVVGGFIPPANRSYVVDVEGYENPGATDPILTFEVFPPGTGDIRMDTVQVTLTLDRKSYTINITARLVNDAAYGMEAELTPISSVVPQPALQEEASDPGNPYQSNPMKWKLGWITKAS